jgi:hypothetical protein
MSWLVAMEETALPIFIGFAIGEDHIAEFFHDAARCMIHQVKCTFIIWFRKVVLGRKTIICYASLNCAGPDRNYDGLLVEPSAIYSDHYVRAGQQRVIQLVLLNVCKLRARHFHLS